MSAATTRTRWLGQLPWLPIPVFIVLYLVLEGGDSVSFEPRLLLPTLNILCVTGVSFLVAWLAARSYLLGQSAAVLLLGCGMLAFGTASAFAAAAVFYRVSADITVTVHNAGALLAGLCCLASAYLAARPDLPDRVLRHAPGRAILAYVIAAGFVVLVAAAELDGLLPDFFIAGVGPTLVRQAILGSAVLMFVLAAVLFRMLGSRSPSPFFSWYSLGLLLIAMGLAGVLTQHTVGSAVSWLGRGAQYLGCIYMYVAVLSVPGGAEPWAIPLDQMLRETRDRYRALLEFSPDPILVHSDGKYVFANPAAARLLRARSVDDVVGKGVLDIVHADDHDVVRERIRAVGVGAATPLRELRIVRFDGSDACVESTAARVEFRGRPAFLVVLRDITERKRIERALLEGERRVRNQNALLEGINRLFRETLACETEADLAQTCLRIAQQVTGSRIGFVGRVNAEGLMDDIAISDTGWSACQMERGEGGRIPLPTFRIRGLYGSVLRDGKAFFCNDPAGHPDSVGLPAGHPPLTAFLGAPLVHQGATMGMIGLANREGGYGDEQLDALQALVPAIVQVFMHQRAEAAVRDADRRKSEFLATLSHELRNPLEPIRYALELLRRPEAAAEARLVIERQLSHLVRLVDDLLDVTRVASNKIQIRRQRVELSAVIRHAVEAASPEIVRARHSLAVSLPADQVWLDADPDRLQQVIINLLNNAAHYTPQAGKIAITAGVDEGQALISVRDTGVGLQPEDLTRVFEMFTQIGQPGHGGLGIGLALVKGVVELHGGSVEARSDGRGLGSEFRVRLPRASEAAGAAPEPSAAPQLPAIVGPLRVLVVDDNFDAAQMMKTFLEFEGHDVRVAGEGVSALAVLRGFDAQVGLLDIGLPGMDGYELAQRIRREPAMRSMYLIAVTGWGQESDRQRARDCGFDAHLTKPADPEDLNRLLACAVRPADGAAAT